MSTSVKRLLKPFKKYLVFLTANAHTFRVAMLPIFSFLVRGLKAYYERYFFHRQGS